MLYKSISIFIFLLITGLFMNAQELQNPQLAFDRANTQLQQGNIQKALAIYHQMEKEQVVSGALFLNMGLSYIQLNSMGKAKYYFLKARQFDETNAQATEALSYVETRFSHQSALLPVLPWEKGLNWLGSEAGPTALIAIGLLLLNLGIFLYIRSWFITQKTKIASRTATVSAVLGCLIILLAFYTSYRQKRYSKAVMITQETNVVEQPGTDATLVNQAFEGYEFTVDHTKSKNQPNWSYVRMSNGLYGWIPTKEIMIL